MQQTQGNLLQLRGCKFTFQFLIIKKLLKKTLVLVGKVGMENKKKCFSILGIKILGISVSMFNN